MRRLLLAGGHGHLILRIGVLGAYHVQFRHRAADRGLSVRPRRDWGQIASDPEFDAIARSLELFVFGLTADGALPGNSLLAQWNMPEVAPFHPVPEPASDALLFSGPVVSIGIGSESRRRRRA